VVSINETIDAVLECETGDLRWINHTGLDHVAEVTGLRVEAKVFILRSRTRPTTSALVPGVLGDLAHGLFKRALYDVHPNGLIVVELELLQGRQAAQKSVPPPGQCLPQQLPWLRAWRPPLEPFSLSTRSRCRTHLDDRDASDELPDAPEAFPVIVRCSLFDLRTKLFDSAFNRLLLPAPATMWCCLYLWSLLGAAQFFDFNVLELYAEILGDGLTTSEWQCPRDRLRRSPKPGLSPLRTVGASQLVHHQGGQASPSMSSEMISSGLLILAVCSSKAAGPSSS